MSGIDNTSIQIAKKMSTQEGLVKQLQEVLPIAIGPAPAKAKVPAVKPVKEAKVKAEKPAKTAKPATKPAVVEKLPLKQVLVQILQTNGPTSATDLYKKATDSYGSWSRQSLYNALKDQSTFTRSGDEVRLTERQGVAPSSTTGEKDAADLFIAKVEDDAAVSQMVLEEVKSPLRVRSLGAFLYLSLGIYAENLKVWSVT